MVAKYLFIVLTFFAWASLASEQAKGKLSGARHVEEMPSWFKQSFLELKEDVQESLADNKNLILYFHQDGCPYCAQLIADNFTNDKLVTKINNNFDVVEINIWGDREVITFDDTITTEKEFARSLNVQFTPVLLFFDDNGEVIIRLNGYQTNEQMHVVLDYITSDSYQSLNFIDYLAINIDNKGTLNKQEFFAKKPYILARNKTHSANNYLAVLFETPNCTACDEFHHNILDKTNIRTLLTQMEVVQLDIMSDKLIDIDGNKTSAKDLYKKLDLNYIPALVIFDKSGTEIIRQDALLKEFHFESLLDYAVSDQYKNEPSFQKYIQQRVDKIIDSGTDVDIWK